MGWTMTWITILSIGLVVRGCGSDRTDYHRVLPGGYRAISFSAGGKTNSVISHDLGVLLDAGATAIGNGDALGGPASIYDTISVLCTFTFDSATHTEAIQITTNPNNCVNDNECIVCSASGNGTTACGLICDGIVPATAAVAADSFDVGLAFTSVIATRMPDPYGTIRYDAERIGTAFDLTTPQSLDTSGCTYDAGVAHELGVSVIAPETWFTSTPSNYRRGFTITALDPDIENDNMTFCTVISTFAATPTLAGAATPGTTVLNDLGTVTFKTKICDYMDTPPTPQDTSMCTEQ